MAKNRQTHKNVPQGASAGADSEFPSQKGPLRAGSEPPRAGSGPAGGLSRLRTVVLMLLLIAGAVLSGLLLLDHYGVSPAGAAVSQLCGDAEDSGCAQVAQSEYSSFGGVSLAAVGLFFYSSLLLLLCISLPGGSELRNGAALLVLSLLSLALALDVILLGLQAFSIHAFCKLCLATYGINLAGLILMLPARSGLSLAAFLWRESSAKMALAAWSSGSVMLLVSIATAEYVLASQAAQREANLLGTPAIDPIPDSDAAPSQPATSDGPASPETEEGGGPAGQKGQAAETALKQQLLEARAELRRLQQTLDDPNKYQEYRLDKAEQEFERAKPQQLDLTGVPSKGPAQAPIRVVEFSDFLCPYCRAFAGAMRNYLPQSRGHVVIFFKNYPLDKECNSALKRTVHAGACKLALGAICAQQQGRFWAYHDKVFERPRQNPSAEDAVGLAAKVGVDTAKFWACMGSAAAREELAGQIAEARRVQVNSTPSVFVNGRKLPNVNAFLKAIEFESKRLGLQP